MIPPASSRGPSRCDPSSSADLPSTGPAAQSTFNPIYVTPPNGSAVTLEDHLKSGQLQGLLDLRDKTAPEASTLTEVSPLGDSGEAPRTQVTPPSVDRTRSIWAPG